MTIDLIIVLGITNDFCLMTILQHGSSLDHIDFVIPLSDNTSSDCNNDRDWNYIVLHVDDDHGN